MKRIAPRALRAFHEQYWYGEHFLADYVSDYLRISQFTGLHILEVGTAEAGLLRYFGQLGANCFGLELSEVRYENSLVLNPDRKFKLILGDITDARTYQEELTVQMDLVILRDVIEHLEDKRGALVAIRNLLAEKGVLFVSFPPKYSPYSGHQQIVKNRSGKVPYLHFLPDRAYREYLRWMGQPQSSINYLLQVKRNRISIGQMERLFESAGLVEVRKDLYFSRPNYKFRYGFPTLRNPFEDIPMFRELFSNGALFLAVKGGEYLN